MQDFGGARDFLLTLGGSPEAKFTFQTFDDAKNGSKSLSKIVHGVFDSRFKELKQFNDNGASISVAVNQTDGKGRASENVTSIRAVFVDLDDSPIEPILEWKLKPHIVVESSKNRYHAYWLVKDFPPEKFSECQRALALLFDGDKACGDLPRAMRLPGFFHKKAEPFLTKIYQKNDLPHYNLNQFQEAFLKPKNGIVFDLILANDAGKGVVKDEPFDLPPITTGILKSALMAIPAREYDTWLRMCFALRTAVDEKQINDDDAFKMFDAWSATADNYNARAVQDKWETKTRNAVTLGSLFRLAQDGGWNWRIAKNETTRQLIESRESGEQPWPKCGERDIDLLNEKHFVAVEQGKTIVMNEEYDEILKRKFLSRSHFYDFTNRYMNVEIQMGVNNRGKPQFTQLGKYWLSHQGRRQYDKIIFQPGGKTSPDVYNLWRGWAVEPKQGDWRCMKEHIYENLCNGNKIHCDFVLNWMARGVQIPYEPGRSAVVLRGKKGTGKSSFAHAYGSIFGQHYIHIVNNRQLTGNFNSHLRDAVVVFADEAVWGGAKQEESVLKGLVTEDTLIIEGKGRDAISMKNYAHLIIATDNEWAIPAGPDERRFFVLEVNDRNQRDSAFFEKIKHQMKNGGYSAMLYDLLTRDIENFDPYNPPNTNALLEQKMHSFDPFMSYMFTILHNGVLPMDTPWENHIPCIFIYDDFIKKSEKSHHRNYLGNEIGFGMKMFKLFKHTNFKRSQIQREIDIQDNDGMVKRVQRRVNHYIFPSLEVCRAAFEKAVRQKIEWPEIELQTVKPKEAF